jgi:flagellar assembly protein FliH
MPSGPEAERIRDLLLREFQSRIERERAQAFEAGREAGRAAAQQELQAPLERVARSLDELAACRARYRKETEREVVQLALEIARRILRRELSIDPEAILGLVRAGLESISLREVLEVRLHPSHAETVRLCLKKMGAPAGLAVIADPHLEPGAVLVETRRGGFDASADAQLEEIQRGFADLLENGEAP